MTNLATLYTTRLMLHSILEVYSTFQVDPLQCGSSVRTTPEAWLYIVGGFLSNKSQIKFCPNGSDLFKVSSLPELRNEEFSLKNY